MCASVSRSPLNHTASINRQGSVTPVSRSLVQNRFSYQLRRGAGIFLAVLALPAVLSAQNDAPAQDHTDLEKRLEETGAALAKVHNYTAVFHRIERVKGKLTPEEISIFKFMRPFKIYMRCISPNKGQESLYILGANEDKVRAHGTGLTKFITVDLDPTGSRAMQNSRHPITEAGLEFLTRKVSTNLQRGVRAGEFTSKEHGVQMVYGRKTQEIEGILPKDASKGYYCYRCIVNFDLETGMPIRTQIYDWEDKLVEYYGFENLKLDPGLTDKDFDSNNAEYHF